MLQQQEPNKLSPHLNLDVTFISQSYSSTLFYNLLIMSDIRSNSSYAISAIQLNSKSLNPLDSINPAVIAKIKRQADSYQDCASKCSAIWASLAKNDIAGANLTEKVLEVIFKEYQTDLHNFTKISSIKDFMRIFDQDKDGTLNPDEQIGIFSFIKERLELIANNCLQIQLYVKFETLMKEVRELQGYIAKWQDHLREKVHKGQISKYRNEGENRVDQFCERFDNEFQQLQKTMIERRQAFEKKAFYESQELQTRLSQPSEYLKIKPKNRLKQLQFQEKLVSLQERVYEALDFRKQLSELQVREKDRVDRLMQEHAEQQRDTLRRRHEKERRELQSKLGELEDKLIMKMKREFQILRKKNNLHEMEIRRLQGLEKKWATKKGLEEPELKRIKKLKNQRNEILEEYKKSMFGGSSKIEDAIQQGQGPSKFNAKTLLSSTLKFGISSRAESEQPINTRSLKPQGSMAARINKYIAPKTADKGYSLTKLYDNNLEVHQQPAILTQNQKQFQKSRKFQFVMSKMNY